MQDITKPSPTTIENWYKELFPNTTLCPNPTDYCSKCYVFHQKITALNVKIHLFEVDSE